MLTLQEVESALPSHLKINVTQDMVDELNNLSNDPEAARNMRENFISYTNVMREGRFKLEDYVSAVAYVSYKLMGYTNKESYQRTFPDRYTILVAKGTSDKDISAYVAAYNKNKLVNLILEQSLIPTWVLNQDMYQEALNQQFYLMKNANSEKVQTDAANSILTHLKKPENKKVELEIGVKNHSGLEEMKKAMVEMAELQQQMIEGGASTKSIAHARIIDAEIVED